MVRIEEAEENDHPNSELHKELAIINFNELSKSLQSQDREKTCFSKLLIQRQNKVFPIENSWKNRPQTQIALFQGSMKMLLLFGKIIGLNPVISITNVDIAKIKFKYLSFWYIYSMLIFFCQLIATVLCIYRLCHNAVSIELLAYVSFFSGITTTSFLFLRIAAKWPTLMKEIVNSSLDGYVDPSVRMKCKAYTVVILACALTEHILCQSSKLSRSIVASEKANSTVYDVFLQKAFPWFLELGIPFNVPLGIFLQFINIISTMNWSFSDVFIVCMSFYLVSVLNQINKTIQDADKVKFCTLAVHCHSIMKYCLEKEFKQISSIRCDPNSPRCFEEEEWRLLHGLRGNNIWHSSTGISINTTVSSTGQFSPLNGSEVYFMVSFVFILGRFLAVSFVAASVHTASLAPAPALYTVTSTAYCTEVQRLQEQINGSTVALSGLQFFYVTRGLVLSVAGTVVTYELVLLQFSDES